jgi:hypothetical protein
MIIQTIGLDPSGAVWTDEASNVSRPDPACAIQVDAEHPSRNRKVEASTAVSVAAGAVAFAGLWACCSCSSAGLPGYPGGRPPLPESPDGP